MIITQKSLSRRTILRGLGASVTLPFLDAMAPAFAAAPAAIRRMVATYVPHGMCMPKWTPSAEGPLQLSPILEPLKAFQSRMLVVSGLDSKQGSGADGGPHPRMQTSWLTGARAKKTDGVDIHAGTSMDQIAAKTFGQTQLASLELALESVDLLGTCALGYSCAYNNTIAWRSPTMPLPMENNPRAVFERLFGASDSTDSTARLRDMRKDRSILDSVTEQVGLLQSHIGRRDKTKLAEYLDAVREIERRIQTAEAQSSRELPVVERPRGIPDSFEQHGKLMMDMQVLAFQTDMTRVGTFLIAREGSVQAYPEIGVSEPHHPLSHHGENPEKLERLAKINVLHLSIMAHFLERLRETPDGDGTLLDHTMLLYGSGMSNSNQHAPINVPTLVVAGAGLPIKTGRHLRLPEKTPLANVQLGLLNAMGVPVDTFGDSTGAVDMCTV